MASGRRSNAAVNLRVVALALLTVAPFFAASAAHAADAGDIAEGMRLYPQKGNCQACHGWAGDGRKMDNQMPTGRICAKRNSIDGVRHDNQMRFAGDRNAGVRQVRLQRRTLLRQKGSRSQGAGHQHGRSAGDITAARNRAASGLPDAKIVGKGPMDRAKCVEYWGGASEVCNEFK